MQSNDNYTEIYELLKKVGMRKYDIKFQNIIIDTDLKEVREIHKQIIEKEKMENNNFLNFMPFIQKSINVFKDNKLDQLIYLNEFIEEEEKVYIANNKELNAIKNNLGIAVRSTINGINRTKFKEYDIYLLEIMPKINQYLNEEDRFSLFQNTKLNSNEKEIAEKIFDIIIKNKLFIYFDNKKKFFNNVIKNIKGIEYIKYIAQIASGIKDIADELYNWVSNNIKSYKKELKLNIKEDLFSVFGNLINYNQANQLLKLIWNNINDKEATEIFIYFLENISLYKLYLNYNFHQKIIDYFFKDINYPITIPNVLANQEIKKCQKMKDYIFAELKNKIISLDEFYYYNTTPNIELIEELKKNNFFNDEIYQNYEYTKKTVELINKIKSNFENGDLIYEKASIIFSNFIQWNDYQYKFRSIFLFNEKNDDENILRLSMKFKDDVIKIQTSLTDLEEIKKFFVEFYKNSKQKEISDINDLNNLLTKNKLKLYIEIINKDTYKNIIKYIEEAININKLNKESYCFKQIYEEEKLISQRNQGENNEDKENEYNILKNTIQKFNDLKNIFENEKNKSVDNTNKFLIEIFLKYSDEELLYKEIKFLKFYFNINMKDEIIRKIKMNIIILALNNSINYILLGLKEINNIFKENIEQNVEDDILKKIDEYLVIIENENIEKEKKEEILTFLKKFNIYLLGEEEQKIEFDINNKKDNIKYNIQNRKRFLEFLKLIKNDPSSIYFILTQNEKNAKFLLEYLVESDEKKNLQEKDIQGFIKTVQLFEKILKIKYKYSEFIKLLNNAITFPNDSNYLGEYINNSMRNINGIKVLYNDSMDKSGSSSLIIASILTNSLAKLTYNNITIEYFKNDKDKNILDIEALEELRGKAVIMKSYMRINKGQEIVLDNNYNNVKIFADLIQQLKILNNYLNNLYNIGIPEPDNFIITIHITEKDFSNIIKDNKFDYSKIDCSMCGKIFKLKSLINYLHNIKNKIEEMTEEFYEENEYIRFFYGKTFELINSNLKQKKFLKLFSIFKSLSNDKIINIVENYKYNNDLNQENNTIIENKNQIQNFENNIIIFDQNKSIDPIISTYKIMLSNVSEYCKQVFALNKISTENIYITNQIKIREEKEKENYVGVFISKSSKQNNDKTIIAFFSELTGSFPNRATLLICNEETSKEEIVSFLYRVFFCPCHSLFIINKSDSLKIEKKIFLIGKVVEFLKFYKHKMKSLLIIFYSDEESKIKKGFNNIEEVQVFKCKFEDKIYKEDYLFNFEKLQKIKVIQSDICGLGKSTYIKSQIKNNQNIYIYFQIGGIFNRKSIFDRIQKEMKLNAIDKEYIIHIDLTFTELNELVKEFLFKFLVMKYFDCDDKIFCYDQNQVEIYIEIHDEIYDYFEKYPILKFCQLYNEKFKSFHKFLKHYIKIK